jgi:hypothetical protein
MTGDDSHSSANEPEADEGIDPANAFAALSDSVRVDILRELSAHRRETGTTVIGFADLRKRVGVRDSGRFRYHLNELRDRFVEKVNGGYRLTHAGTQVVGAILAGTYTDAVSMGPVELDSECPICGGAAIATCEDGRCRVTCPEGHPLFQWSVPPNAATDATVREVVDLAELLGTQAVERALAGLCPQCYDPVDPTVAIEDPPRPVFRAICDTCGARVVGPLGLCLLVDPDVAAACRRHGLILPEAHVWEFPFVGPDTEVRVIEADPLRVAVTLAFEDETLVATVGGSGTVVDVTPEDDE